MGSDFSDRNIYDEARDRIQARIGETEETTEVVSSPLLVYYQSLGITLCSTRVDHALCGDGFYSLSHIDFEQVEVRPALPGAWVPANASTHAEPLYAYRIVCSYKFSPIRGSYKP